MVHLSRLEFTFTPEEETKKRVPVYKELPQPKTMPKILQSSLLHRVSQHFNPQMLTFFLFGE